MRVKNIIKISKFIKDRIAKKISKLLKSLIKYIFSKGLKLNNQKIKYFGQGF